MNDRLPCKPDFFLVGAPKCGTTAMATYLGEHPQVCFSRPKEPYHFCEDLPAYDPGWSDEEYLHRCFAHCSADHEAVGEGSVFYLFSRVAVPRILEFQPRARFLVHVRNPVDLAYSFHGQMRWNYFEDEEDFARAWELQEARKEGRRIPAHCQEPQLLQYREVASVGSQLERLLEQVSPDRVHVVFQEDLAQRPAPVYEGVLAFLGVASDGRREFPRVNPSKAPRSRLLAHFTQRPPPDRLLRWWEGVKRLLGLERLGVLPALRRINARRARRPPLEEDVRRRILADMESEIAKLESLCERDLSAWLAE